MPADMCKDGDCMVATLWNDFEPNTMLYMSDLTDDDRYSDNNWERLKNEREADKFNYCPFCGKKINWEQLKKQKEETCKK